MPLLFTLYYITIQITHMAQHTMINSLEKVGKRTVLHLTNKQTKKKNEINILLHFCKLHQIILVINF